MVKVSESRSTARRALLSKRADTMHYMVGDDTSPSYEPTHVSVSISPVTGKPVVVPFNDYTLSRYLQARREDFSKMPFGQQIDHAALESTDPANRSLARDVFAGVNPLFGVPHNLLKARGNYLRARQAAHDGDLDSAFASHVDSVGNGAMAALSLVPGLSFAGKALRAAPGFARGMLTGRGSANLVNRGVRLLTGGHGMTPKGEVAVRTADVLGKGATLAGSADLATGYTSRLRPELRDPARAVLGAASVGALPTRLYSSALQAAADATGLSQQVGRYLGAQSYSHVRALPPVHAGTYAVRDPASLALGAMDYAAPSDLSSAARQAAQQVREVSRPAMSVVRRAVTGDYAKPAVHVSGSTAPVIGKGFVSALARRAAGDVDNAGGMPLAYRKALVDGLVPNGQKSLLPLVNGSAEVSPLLERLLTTQLGVGR